MTLSGPAAAAHIGKVDDEMKQRTERMGVEIQAALGEIMARGEIKDPRVRNAGLVTVTQVRVTGDLREARVVFTVHGADQARLERTREGLTSARSYLQAALARRLRTRNTPTLTFEIDRALDHAFRLDGLLREVAATRAAETRGREPAAQTTMPRGDDKATDARRQRRDDTGATTVTVTAMTTTVLPVAVLSSK